MLNVRKNTDMVTRTAKQKATKPVSAVDAEIEKAHPLIKSFIEEYRKENARLQNLIAKNQVAHESEINKIRAEAYQKIVLSKTRVIPPTATAQEATDAYMEMINAGKNS